MQFLYDLFIHPFVSLAKGTFRFVTIFSVGLAVFTVVYALLAAGIYATGILQYDMMRIMGGSRDPSQLVIESGGKVLYLDFLMFFWPFVAIVALIGVFKAFGPSSVWYTNLRGRNNSK